MRYICDLCEIGKQEYTINRAQKFFSPEARRLKSEASLAEAEDVERSIAVHILKK